CPTDCCDETRRLNIARRFGSAMISNTDSILLVYSAGHIRVKVYIQTHNFANSCLPFVVNLILQFAWFLVSQFGNLKFGNLKLRSSSDKMARGVSKAMECLSPQSPKFIRRNLFAD